MSEEQKTITYDAFISYRHAELDSFMAEKLHKVLETYKLPRNLAKKLGRKSITRVFRDRDELPTSSSLSDNISQALKNSSFLIVICSPRTPESVWVRKEVETFIELHGHDRVLALLIEGEPADSFPPELLTLPDGTRIEPLAADVRAESKRASLKLLKTEKLRLIAALIGCRYDDLKQRHRERTIKKILSLSFTLSAFFMAFAGVTLFQYQQIVYQSEQVKLQKANVQREQSLFLSFLSDSLLIDGDCKTAALLALEALPENLEDPEKPYVEEAEHALCEALNVYMVSGGFQGDFSVSHKRSILYSTLSPDCTMFLTVGDDNVICVWDTSTGTELQRLAISKKGLSPKAYFSADSSMIFTNLDDNILKAWDIQSGELVWSFGDDFVKTSVTTKMDVSADASAILYYVGGNYNTSPCIYLIDPATGKVLAERTLKEELENVVLSDQARYMASASKDKWLEVYDISGENVILREEISDSEEMFLGCELTFSHDENNLLISYFSLQNDGYEYHIQHYDLGSQTLLFDHDYFCSFVDYGIGNVTYSNLEKQYIIFTNGRNLVTLDYQGEEVFTITLANNIAGVLARDTLLFLSDTDGNCCTYSSENGQEYSLYSFHLKYGVDTLHAGGGYIVGSSSRNKNAYVVKLMEPKNITEYAELPAGFANAVINPANDHALIRTGDNLIYECPLTPDTEARELALSDINTTCYITDDIILALGNDAIYQYDLQHDSITKQLSCPNIKYHEFSPDKTRIAYVSDYHSLTLADTQTLEQLYQREFESFVQSVVYNEAGTLIFVITNSAVEVLDAVNGQLLHTFDIENVKNLTVSSDGLICLTDGEFLYLYDRDFLAVTTLEPMLPVASISFSPFNGDLLVAMDKCFVVYDSSYQEKMYQELEFTVTVYRYRDDPHQIFIQDSFHRTYILNGNSYKILGRIQCLLDTDAEYSFFLSPLSNQLVATPIYSLEMLIEEANRQLNGRVLTTAERIAYFIED